MSGSLPRGSLSDMLGFDPEQVQPNELLQRIQRNPVGLNQFAPSAGNPSPGFDPQVGVWNGQPITAGQAAAFPVNPLSGALNPAGEMVANTLMGASSGVVPKAGAAVASGIRAYHGSPHEFDRFSTSKIGTGEGAQAYGHGLYFAENEGVARSYRDALANNIHPDNIKRFLDASHSFDKAKQEAAGLRRGPQLKALKAAQAAAQAEMDAALAAPRGTGHMYEVNVRADPARFLEWDKPRDQLAPEVQAFARANAPSAWENAADGASLYQLMARELGGPAAVSEALGRAGVPGIRYLDGSSRRAGGGGHNTVVFDDATLEVIRRYGLAGILGGGAAGVAAGGGSSEQ